MATSDEGEFRYDRLDESKGINRRVSHVEEPERRLIDKVVHAADEFRRAVLAEEPGKRLVDDRVLSSSAGALDTNEIIDPLLQLLVDAHILVPQSVHLIKAE